MFLQSPRSAYWRGRRDIGALGNHSRGVEEGRNSCGTANDLWIAASAMQHGLPILTSDRDFQKIPQIIVRHFHLSKKTESKRCQTHRFPYKEMVSNTFPPPLTCRLLFTSGSALGVSCQS